MFCTQCGSAYPPNDRFCANCGAALPGAAVVPAQISGQIAPPAVATASLEQPVSILEGLRRRVQRMASTEDLEGFSLKQLFSEVFKHRGPDEVEEYLLLVGTAKTTPAIDLVETGWPKPWLFFRVLATMVAAYLALEFTFMQFVTTGANLITGMMILGAFAVPLATLTLFFELNTPRNVSIYKVVILFLIGAVISLGFALFGFSFSILGMLGDMAAGIIEEVAKLLTVVVVMRGIRHKYILNGLLFGATVGAGFAAFETAGYALTQGLLQDGVSGMVDVLRVRAFLAPWGHVAWTAIAAGAFWRVKQDKPLSMSMFTDERFLKAFLIPVGLHMIWDAPIRVPFYGKQVLSAIVSWYVVFGLTQQGLRQVQQEKKEHLEAALERMEATLEPPSEAIT